MTSADVLIVGGGVIGCSIAWHLRHDGFAGRVVVVERDSTYARASSSLAMGGIRQQFSSAANVGMARYSIDFYERFDDTMSAGSFRSDAWLRQRGYLFLVDAENAERFEHRLETQRTLGVAVERWSVDRIRERVPDLMLDDIIFGVFGPRDGYADPKRVLAGFRAGAEHAGAEFVAGEVTSIERANGSVAAVRVGDTRVATGIVVNAAGAYAAHVGGMAGVDLPVHAVRQQLFRCELPTTWPYRFPMTIDPSGVHWRHDDARSPGGADRIVVARTNVDEPEGEDLSCDWSRWGRDYAPPLARRMPAFSGMEPVEGWAGLYEMTPDHNAIIGEHPAVRGFFLANGFSGHGLMMAPATGKAVSDLIRNGASRTIDVSPFRLARFAHGALLHDDAML
jgi:glycine/D-amino acid oxidase-like deaminating enzyme